MVTQIKTVGEEKEAIEKISNKIAKDLTESKNPVGTLQHISKMGLNDILIKRGGDESTVSNVKVETMKKLFTDAQKISKESKISTGEETSSTR